MIYLFTVKDIKNGDNQLTTEIISGPAKGTKIITLFEKNNSGSRVSFQLDLKNPLIGNYK